MKNKYKSNPQWDITSSILVWLIETENKCWLGYRETRTSAQCYHWWECKMYKLLLKSWVIPHKAWRKWQPTPVFLPGAAQGQEPGGLPSMGVTQSWTRLMWLSSSIKLKHTGLAKKFHLGFFSKDFSEKPKRTFGQPSRITWYSKLTPGCVNWKQGPKCGPCSQQPYSQ